MTEATVVSPRPSGHAPPTRGRTTWFPWRGVVRPWLVSRVYSGALVAAMGSWSNHKLTGAGFEKWDGGWYWVIGAQGYGPPPVAHRDSGWPFFPMLPAVVHAFHFFGDARRLRRAHGQQCGVPTRVGRLVRAGAPTCR